MIEQGVMDSRISYLELCLIKYQVSTILYRQTSLSLYNKMSLSTKKKLKLDPFQIYIFIYKFQNNLSKQFGQAIVEFDETNTIVCTNTEETNLEVQKQIRSWVAEYRVEVMSVQLGFKVATKEIQEIESSFDSLVFQEVSVREQFEEMSDRCLDRVRLKIQGKMEGNQESIVMIVRKDKLEEAKDLVKQSQKNNPPGDCQIDLQLNPRKTLTAELLGLLETSQKRLQLLNNYDTIWIQGPSKLCKQFKQRLASQLAKLKILINYLNDSASVKRIQKLKFKFEVNIFSNEQVLQACTRIKQLYTLSGPLQVYKKARQQKQFFVIVTCPLEFWEEVRERLDEASIAPPPKEQKPKYREKDQKIKVKEATIPLKHLNQNDLKEYCVQAGNLQFVNDIRITKNKISNLAYILLNCFQSLSVKKCASFDKYFNYQRYYFAKEVKLKMVPRIIEMVMEKAPKELLSIKFKTGHCCYSYSEINNSEDYKGKVIERIGLNQVEESSENNREFYCFILSGLRSIVVEKEELLDVTVKNMNRIAIEEVKWTLRVPPPLRNHIKNKRISDTIQSQIKQIFNNAPKHITLESISISKESIICQVCISNENLQSTKANHIQKQFESLFEFLTVEVVKQKHITLEKLEKLVGSGLFVKDQESIVMISFKDTPQSNNILKQTLLSHSKEHSIVYPIHLLQFLKDNLNDIQCEVKFVEDPFDSRIKIEGYSWNVEQAVNTITELIKVGEKESSSINFTVNSQVLEKLKEKDILRAIADKYKLKLEVKSINYSKWRFKYTNGNRVYVNQIPIPQNTSSCRVFFHKNDFQPHIPNSTQTSEVILSKTGRAAFVPSVSQIPVLDRLRKEKLVVFLRKGDEKLLEQILEEYGRSERLKPLSIYSELDIDNYMEDKEQSKSLITETVTYGWIQNGAKIPYNPKSQLILRDCEKKNKKSITLTHQDLDIHQPLFTLNKQQLIIRSNNTKKQYKIIHSQLNREYLIVINDTEVPILSDQYDTIQNHPVSEVGVTLALYKVDLEALAQTNLLTQYQRKVFRTVETNEKKVEYILDHFNPSSSLIIYTVHNKSQQVLEKVKQKFNEQMSALEQGEINLSIKTSIMSISELIDLCEERNIDVVIHKESEGSASITLKSHDVRIVKQVVHDYKIRESETSIVRVAEKVEYPLHWCEQQELIMKVEVNKNSDEFIRISGIFQVSKINKLYIIQNNYLWKKYHQEKRDLEQLTEKPIKQLYLFHGTRSYNPQNIFLDKQESFNINFSSDKNFFGRGIYFAKQAQYCHDYAHKVSSYVRQILYCKVMVGESQVLGTQDRSPDIKDTAYRDVVKKIKYESIMSVYPNTDVYIVYKSRRAYPQYLIEY